VIVSLAPTLFVAARLVGRGGLPRRRLEVPLNERRYYTKGPAGPPWC
jgi:hypothetical protein